MSLIIVLLLVVASISKVMAFSPTNLQHQAPLITHHQDIIAINNRGRLSSQLYMNKKKRKNRSNKSSSKSKAFGGSTASSSSSTLIKPKTTSNFQYAGTIKPGLQSPKRIVPSEKIQFPDYAVSLFDISIYDCITLYCVVCCHQYYTTSTLINHYDSYICIYSSNIA